MTASLALRRHLYEQLRTAHGPRRRRALRRQIALLAGPVPGRGEGGDDGSSGVRAPRRLLPPSPLGRSLPGQSTRAL